MDATKRPRRRRRWVIGVLLVLAAPIVVFVVNGTLLAAGTTPVLAYHPDVTPTDHPNTGEVTIVAYNIAKCFAHEGGISFKSRADVDSRVKKLAAVIRAENPDIVFLSEALTEAGPCRVDQVTGLAIACGMPYTAFGENYNFGVPGMRVVGGNAILSRFPLEEVANIDLAGRRPFYVTGNNRRALFVSAKLDGTNAVLLGALHNDSFDHRNNERQVRQLLDFIGERSCILAGDFNAVPGKASMTLVRESSKFVGEIDGPPSFPADIPDRRIDFVLAPVGWEHVGTKILDTEVSDHRPVIARFRFDTRGR